MKQFLYMAAYDIRFSFRKNRLKWLAALGIQLFLCVRIFGEIKTFTRSYDLLSELWLVMCGEREYILTQDSMFQLPAYWILFHGYLFFLIGFYPVNELYLGNGQTCIRSHSRKRWLVSKFVSVAVNVLLYYGCFIVLLLLGNVFLGGTILPESGFIGFMEIPIASQNMTEIWLAFLILPFLVSLALGELQVVLSFGFNPVFAFMGMIGYMIASVFWMHPCFLGNFAMLYRQAWISGKAEIDVTLGIQICIALLVITFVSGIVLFQKKDILPEE